LVADVIMYSWDEKWAKRRAENLLVEYVRGIEGRTLESTLGEIKSLLSKGLTEKHLMEIISKIETNPLYFPLQDEIHRRRLNDLKERIKKMLGTQFTS